MSENHDEPSCENCRFWNTFEPPGNWSSCQRYPPKQNNPGDIPYYPEVHGSNWCGEHQPKNAPAEPSGPTGETVRVHCGACGFTTNHELNQPVITCPNCRSE